MEKTSKIIKVLFMAVILIAVFFALSGLSKSRRASEVFPEAPASEETDLPAGGSEAAAPPDTVQEKDNASVPVTPSTPEERASRTVSPSDAASYSEEDLPADF